MARELVFSFTKKDFDIDWFSGTGAGGQHRNKHQNCVRFTHKATGLITQGTDHRDRTSNLRDAFKKMVPLLVNHYAKTEAKARYVNPETIRTYHEPDNRVKDHASGLVQTYREVVGKNYLDDMIDARAVAVLSIKSK